MVKYCVYTCYYELCSYIAVVVPDPLVCYKTRLSILLLFPDHYSNFLYLIHLHSTAKKEKQHIVISTVVNIAFSSEGQRLCLYVHMKLSEQ